MPRKLILAGCAVVLLFGVPYVLGRRQVGPAEQREEQTIRVEKRSFANVLRLNGTTQAARSFTVLAPRLQGAQLSSMVVTKLVPAGTHVAKDDVLVEFDPQAQVKDYLDKEGAYKDFVGQVAQKQADEDIARAKDDTEIKQAEDELKRSELELKKNEVVSKIDAEKHQQAFEEAQANLKQLRETYELKRRAAKAGIRSLEIQRDRAEEAMHYAQSNAAKMIIHAPMPGVAVMNTIWLGGRMGVVQQGDEVRPGVPFMQVVDPSQMEVRAEVNQQDVLKIKKGQRAQIHLDAYPGLALSANLEELGPLGHNGQFSQMVRAFPARFAIQGNDPRLLPDLSAALDVELEAEKDVLLVPRQSVGGEPGHEFVMLKSGGSFEKREVKTGLKNDLEVVVLSGLADGDVIQRTLQGQGGAGTQK
ncbi:MAG TPA: HlyD family efflux transporter periplasmic adaptor subunit [Candidatus Methylomirabilis sp.]|nr:HlyD family efflux transporter periplasmic adaptor subunit [Candidatus Methylomirabilis sp.]